MTSHGTTPPPDGTSLARHSFEELRRSIDSDPGRFRAEAFRAFFDDLDPSESQRVERLWQAVQGVRHDEPEPAAREAETLIRAMPDDEDGSGAIAVRTFAEAILGRIRSTEGHAGNLYLGARAPGAQLRAFELLRLRTPLIPFAYAAGNRAILEAVEPGSDVTLIDVGIGRGGQLRALLRNPVARRAFRSVHVIGVEPDSSTTTGAGALETAEQNVLSAGQEVGIPTEFTGIAKTAEDLTTSDLVAAGLVGQVVATSSFCLHHLDVERSGGRAGVLSLLRDVGASAVVVVEPDSNHYEDDLAIRFLHAYRHYRTIARSLHGMLAPADASLVWSEFFAPEVHNVISHDGPARTERHEESSRWAERIEQAGFRLDALADVLPQSAAPPGFQVQAHGVAFCLSYQSVSLLAVLRGRA